MDQAELVRNIRERVETALSCVHCENENARGWYRLKKQFIRENARKYGMDPEVATNVYAILSANTSESENDRLFLAYLRKQRVGHFGDVKRRLTLAKRRDPRALEYKAGRKITSFAWNLAHPYSYKPVVTADRWAIRIAYDDPTRKRGNYELMRRAYTQVAREFGLRPSEAQALPWVHVVERHDDRAS